MVYGSEKGYKFCHKIGLSPNTYNKFFNKAIKDGYLRQVGSHYQFIDLSKIMFDLFELTQSKQKWLQSKVRFFTGVQYKDIKYKSVLSRIEFAFMELNFKQQEYLISVKNKAKQLLENRFICKQDYQWLKKAKKALKAKDMTEVLSISSKVVSQVRTGKYHVATNLGTSPSTALNRLRKWDKTYINRVVVNDFHKTHVCNESFDYYKHKVSPKHKVIPMRNGFNVSKGSVIIPLIQKVQYKTMEDILMDVYRTSPRLRKEAEFTCLQIVGSKNENKETTTNIESLSF